MSQPTNIFGAIRTGKQKLSFSNDTHFLNIHYPVDSNFYHTIIEFVAEVKLMSISNTNIPPKELEVLLDKYGFEIISKEDLRNQQLALAKKTQSISAEQVEIMKNKALEDTFGAKL